MAVKNNDNTATSPSPTSPSPAFSPSKFLEAASLSDSPKLPLPSPQKRKPVSRSRFSLNQHPPVAPTSLDRRSYPHQEIVVPGALKSSSAATSAPMQLSNLKLLHLSGNQTSRRDLEQLPLENFDSILILADEELEASENAFDMVCVLLHPYYLSYRTANCSQVPMK